MTDVRPITFEWTDDGVMVPLRRHAKQCDRQFCIGERYTLVPHEERSHRSHAHYFASINDAWMNLREDLAEQFPTSEHLRKWCLIKAGFCDRRTLVASSAAEARRLAAFVKPMDEFAIVTVSEATVTVYTAQSQSMRAMGKEAFGRSKQAVLDICAGMIGVQPDMLASKAGKAA